MSLREASRLTTTVRPLRQHPRPVIGLVAGGLGAYWPQSRGLLPQLRRSADIVSERLGHLDAEAVDAGFISDATEAARASEVLRAAGCDLIIMFLTTYMTATMVVPIAQRSGAPLLLLNLQPTESMDYASFGTGEWLAYCGCCPLPEVANALERCGIPSVPFPATSPTNGPGRASRGSGFCCLGAQSPT